MLGVDVHDQRAEVPLVVRLHTADGARVTHCSCARDRGRDVKETDN